MGVTIYTKPGCPYCAAAKNDMIAQGIEFEEIDVYVTPGAQETLAELTCGQLVVPVIVDESGDVRIATGGG